MSVKNQTDKRSIRLGQPANLTASHPHTQAPQGEPENAVMLQAFADSKHYKNFARDVLQVSTQDDPITCSDIPEVPFMQKDCTHQST